MYNRQATSISAVLTADAATLALFAPDVVTLRRHLTAPRIWLAHDGVDGVTAALAGAALWFVAAWLGLGLLAGATGRLPGVAGSLARCASCVLLPQAVQRLLSGMVGLGVLLTPGVAEAQSAHSPASWQGIAAVDSRADADVADPVPAPSWPTDPPSNQASNPVVPLPSWPIVPGSQAPDSAPTGTPAPTRSPPAAPDPSTPRSSRAARTAPAARPRGHSMPGHPGAERTARTHASPRPSSPGADPVRNAPVTVRPGDCLWLIAARRLRSHATDARIAASWPDWYAANRGVIGDDPALIIPGQVLRAPAPTLKDTP